MEGDGVGVGLVGRGVGGLCEVIKCEVIKKANCMIIKEMGGWRVTGWGGGEGRRIKCEVIKKGSKLTV